MNLVNFLALALDKDMIIIYTLIAIMAVLFIIIFTLDAKSRKKNPKEEEIVIKGTTPLEKFQETNSVQSSIDLEAKVEEKIQELEKEKVKEEEIKTEEIKEDSKIQEEPVVKEAEEVLKEVKAEVIPTVEEEKVENIEIIKQELPIEEDSNIKYVPEQTLEEQQSLAKEELNQVVENLIEEDKKEAIELTNFEIEQEENAIISYNELIKVSENLYEENEKTQYADEGNEPITIDQLREKFSAKEEVNEIIEEKSEETEQVVEVGNKDLDLVSAIDEIIKEEKVQKEEVERPKVKLDDFSDFEVKKEEPKVSKFKSSPIISPVYGIEKDETIKKDTELELEQTADLEKLDREIRKTNQFLQVLKELQKKLD